MGDFNTHLEDHSNIQATIFNDTMQVLGLQQHVNKPMHHQGNIHHLIFTKINLDLKASNCKTSENLSDHCLVTVDTNIKKEPWERASKTIHDTSKLNKENLINNFIALILDGDTNFNQTSHQFNDELRKILVAPEKTVKYANKPIKPSFNTYIRDQRNQQNMRTIQNSTNI